jgi:hypothetical protein
MYSHFVRCEAEFFSHRLLPIVAVLPYGTPVRRRSHVTPCPHRRSSFAQIPITRCTRPTTTSRDFVQARTGLGQRLPCSPLMMPLV